MKKYSIRISNAGTMCAYILDQNDRSMLYRYGATAAIAMRNVVEHALLDEERETRRAGSACMAYLPQQTQYDITQMLKDALDEHSMPSGGDI